MHPDMESSGGMKGGWRRRPFSVSVFSEDRARATGGAKDRRRQSTREAADVSSAGGEDDLPGEDISLLDNRPVDKKILRKRQATPPQAHVHSTPQILRHYYMLHKKRDISVVHFLI